MLSAIVQALTSNTIENGAKKHGPNTGDVDVDSEEFRRVVGESEEATVRRGEGDVRCGRVNTGSCNIVEGSLEPWGGEVEGEG